MVITIRKNRVRPSLLTQLLFRLLWWFNNSFTVVFYDSCKYVLPETDQKDVNKLFGYFTVHPHKWSIRWGWWYDPTEDQFVLTEYRYHDGQRIMQDHYRVKAAQPITIGIDKQSNRVYRLDYNNIRVYPNNLDEFSSYPNKLKNYLGNYIGGTYPATKTLEYSLTTINMWNKIRSLMAPLTATKIRIVMAIIALIFVVIPVGVTTAIYGYESTPTIIAGVAGAVLGIAAAYFFNWKIASSKH